MTLGRGREARRDAAYAALMGGDLAGRLGAVYALVELADEWLGEVSLPVGVRRGHVQGVIDRLCAYLRSPLSTAADNRPAGESAGAQGRIQQAIVEEIHRRVQHPVASAEGASLAGTWSGFAFYFSGAVFVCTVNFTGSRWEHEVDFSDCIFMRDALFSCSTFAVPPTSPIPPTELWRISASPSTRTRRILAAAHGVAAPSFRGRSLRARLTLAAPRIWRTLFSPTQFL